MRQSLALLKEFLCTPAHIGAVWPSSGYLAQCVCAMLPASPQKADLIVEIGPGTGAITKHLVQHVGDASLLTLVERSPRLAALLRANFPQLSIVQGDAVELGALLPGNAKASVIISSMPLLTLEESYRQRVIRQIKNSLAAAGTFIFVSYNLKCNKEIVEAGFRSVDHKFIVRNIPPARIDYFVPSGPQV